MFAGLAWICLSTACYSSKNQANDDLLEAYEDKEAVCFVYHRFDDDRYPSTNISASDFKAHLQYLKDHDYSVMSLGQALDYLKKPGEKTKVAVITIDDGYKSFYESGWPLLKEFGYPATLFINTSTVGSGSYMNWKELKRVQESGIEIGNHTDSHRYFLNVPKQQRYKIFAKEIQKSQRLLKQHLGREPVLFAYPYGEFDPEMMEEVKKAGFVAAAAQNSGVIAGGINKYALPRFPMSGGYVELDKFAEKANMHAFRIAGKNPESNIIPDAGVPPELVISFEQRNLKIDQLQCFVQRGKCDLVLDRDDKGLITLKIKAEAPLKSRRTLYTITAPSETGEWHWYSHLWINPDVLGE